MVCLAAMWKFPLTKLIKVWIQHFPQYQDRHILKIHCMLDSYKCGPWYVQVRLHMDWHGQPKHASWWHRSWSWLVSHRADVGRIYPTSGWCWKLILKALIGKWDRTDRREYFCCVCGWDWKRSMVAQAHLHTYFALVCLVAYVNVTRKISLNFTRK